MANKAKGAALGVLAGIGGFVDAGGVMTSSQAGASFRYALLWTLVPGVIGFAVYADMSGRIVIATGRTTFDVIRDRLGGRLALVPLTATTVVNLLTLVVEIGGMALAVRLLLGLPTVLLGVLAIAFLAGLLWWARFEWLDNLGALLGLTMLVSVVAMIRLNPDWSAVAGGLLHPDAYTAHPVPGYLFMTVALLGAYMTPYQFDFYSSGAIEQRWRGEDLLTNRISAILGTCFGGIVTLALTVVAAVILFPRHQQVQSLVDASAGTRAALGTAGLVLFALGTFAVSMGAGIETALAGTYTICQFFGWHWGKEQPKRNAPLFNLLLLLELAVALVVVLTGIDPLSLATITMAFAAFALPFTFLPLLIVANDPGYVGEQRNTRAANVVAGLILALLCLVTLTTVPLLIISGGGP